MCQGQPTVQQHVRKYIFISFKDQAVNGKVYSTDTIALEINIEDIDDRPPKFKYNEYKISIQEEVYYDHMFV